jgi:hypothetical protein
LFYIDAILKNNEFSNVCNNKNVHNINDTVIDINLGIGCGINLALNDTEINSPNVASVSYVSKICSDDTYYHVNDFSFIANSQSYIDNIQEFKTSKVTLGHSTGPNNIINDPEIGCARNLALNGIEVNSPHVASVSYVNEICSGNTSHYKNGFSLINNSQTYVNNIQDSTGSSVILGHSTGPSNCVSNDTHVKLPLNGRVCDNTSVHNGDVLFIDDDSLLNNGHDVCKYIDVFSSNGVVNKGDVHFSLDVLNNVTVSDSHMPCL